MKSQVRLRLIVTHPHFDCEATVEALMREFDAARAEAVRWSQYNRSLEAGEKCAVRRDVRLQRCCCCL